MDIGNWLKKSLLVGVLSTASIFPASSQSFERASKEMDSLASLIIKYHESQTGVSYQDKQPVIGYAKFNDFLTIGKYDTDTIFLSLFFKEIDPAPLLKKIDTSEVSFNVGHLRGSLSHELGHFLTEQYIETYVPDSWLNNIFLGTVVNDKKNTCKFLAIEGIGEYFENIFSNAPAYFHKDDWKKYKPREFKSNWFNVFIRYEGGRNLITPILEKNAHEGLLWVLSNELDVKYNKLKKVPLYRKKALHEISDYIKP